MRIRTIVPVVLAVAVLASALVTLSGCGMVMYAARHGFSTPPASEFGLGPRTSVAGSYSATLDPAAPLRVGTLQSVKLAIRDKAGAPVRGARITVDGGMPQHGHGLPTRPRVVAEEENGVYVVDGLRFNMGGWWELKFAVDGSAGADRVTFNVKL